MVAKKEVKELEHSAVELTITVTAETAKKVYTDLVEKYARTIHMKGFRKGKAPVSVLENKFGESLKAEASMSIMEESLKEVFADLEKKPLPYVVPELKEEANLVLGQDFSFAVTYDTYPVVKLGEYKGIEIEEPTIIIGKEDVDRELEKIREQNAVVVDKKEGKAEKEDILTINYWELDEADAEIPGTRREDFVFTLGTGYNLYRIDDELLGMKAGEEKTIMKEFPSDFEVGELAGQKKRIRVALTKLKEKRLPALDDELAQDVSENYKTLADLTADIEKRLRETADEQVRGNNLQAILDKIAETTEVDIPKAMIDAELESTWKGFVRQTRMQEDQVLTLLSYENKTKESLFEEWKEGAAKSVKKQIIIAKIIEGEKIAADDAEYEEEIKKQAELGKMEAEELRDYFEKNSMKPYIQSGIQEKKLYDFLLSQSKIKKKGKVKFVDLMAKKA
jgi:trigger factor